jgi:ABC-type Zn2+ transport system substrate-binding protein/surface adhesin
MNYLQLIGDMEEIARQLNVQLRYEKGDFEGGYCVLKNQKVVVINKRLPDARRASALAQALAEYGVETTFVKPNVRSYIEDEVAKATKSRNAS